MTKPLSSTEIENMVDDLSSKGRKKAHNKDSKALVKTNDIKPIIDPDIEEVVDNIISLKKGSKKQRFHMYRIFNLPIKTCAKLAGYKPGYGYQLVREYKHNPIVRQSVEKILNDMPEAYRSVCKLRLVQISEIEGKALQEYEDKPHLAIDKPQLLKQLKMGAGIDLNETPGQKPAVININLAKHIQSMIKADIESK